MTTNLTIEKCLKHALLLALHLLYVGQILAIIASVSWLIHAGREYVPYGMAVYGAGVLAVSVWLWTEECEKNGGLSFGDLIGWPIAACMMTPLIAVFWPMICASELEEKWFPRPPHVEKPKTILIRCRKRP